MAEVTNGGDRIIYTTKEILADINKRLERNSMLSEQQDKRLLALETRVDKHDEAFASQLPQLREFMEKMNVQQAVEDALQNKKVGISNYDRWLVGFGTLFVVFLTTIMPRFL